MLSTLLYFSILLYIWDQGLSIPQVKRMSRVEEIYQDTKEQILGALKVPFGEEIPNYDDIYKEGEKLMLEGISVHDYIEFWRRR